MMANEQVWQKASTLLKFAGESAPEHASTSAHQLPETGDVEARTDWLRVMVACKVLLAKEEQG